MHLRSHELDFGALSSEASVSVRKGGLIALEAVVSLVRYAS